MQYLSSLCGNINLKKFCIQYLIQLNFIFIFSNELFFQECWY